MALDGPISYNGLTITPGTVSRTPGGGPGSGLRLMRFDISPVSVAAYLDKAPLRDGMVAADVYLAERTISLGLEIYGKTPGDMWDKLQSFVSTFHPTNAFRQDTTGSNGFLPLTFQQPTANTGAWPAGYIPMQLYARAAAPPSYAESLGYDAGGNAAKGLVMPASVKMLCIDPRKYLQTTQSYVLTTTNSAGLTLRGDYSTWPSASIVMSGPGSATYQIVLLDVNGVNFSTITLNLSSLAASDTITVDWAGRTIKKNGVLAAGILVSATWAPFVGTGMNGATRARHANNTAVTSSTLTWREAWA